MTLRQALALWHGPALPDLPFGQAQAARLEELRLTAGEDLAEAELALPAGASVAELRRLVAAHPLRERFRAQLMRALHAAGRQAEALAMFEEGRHLLAGPSGVEQVARAVLGALGLRESGLRTPQTHDPVQLLVSALAERDTLLLLDNCEHLIASAAELVRTMLAECPRLCVLATSREPLGITGEALVTLTPLALPSAESRTAGMSAVEALRYPAVRLFADRAAAVRPAFEVRRDHVDAVVRICATLDGLPLAIELAAARLRSFDVEEIAARLAEYGRFRLLTRGDRTGAARHRALRAVVEWSWDLLSPEEQTLARRFSVFAGGATIAAVEAVCERVTNEPAVGEPALSESALSPRDEPTLDGYTVGGPVAGGLGDVAGLLADLVDKSLIGVDGGRYRMLETIRLFCAERLAEAGEEGGVRARHARWCEELARRAGPRLRRGESLVRAGELTAASADFRRAREAAERAGRSQAPVMAGLGLGELAWAAGDSAEALKRLEAALAAAQSGGFGARQAEARVLAALARLSDGEGQPLRAQALYRRAFAAARRSPLASDLADAAEWQAEAALAGPHGNAGRQVALLLGVAVALRGLAVAGDPHVARTAAAARRSAGAEAFAAEFARGSRSGREEALTVLDQARAWVSADKR